MNNKLTKLALGMLLALGISFVPAQNLHAADISPNNNNVSITDNNNKASALKPEAQAESLAVVECLKNKDSEGAIGHATKLIELEPTKPAGLLLRAQIYAGTGRINLGIEDLKKAMEIAPKDPSLPLQLGNYYNAIGNRKEALAAYSKSIELKPDVIFSYINRAALYMDMGNKEDFLKDAETIIKLDPEIMVGYYMRGLAYERLGKDAEAYKDLTYFLKALSKGLNGKAAYGILNPKFCNYQTNYKLGRVCYELKKYQEGVNYYTNALNIFPNSVEALVYRGEAYYKMEKYDLSIKDCDKAIELQPRSFDVLVYGYALKADAKIKLKDYEGALKGYETHLAELEKFNPTLYKYMRRGILNDMTYSYMGLKQFDKAEEVIKESLSYERTCINLDTYAELLERTERFEESEKIYNEAISLAKTEDMKKETIEHLERMKKAWAKKKK